MKAISIRKIFTLVLILLLILASATPLLSVYNQQVNLSFFAVSALFWFVYGKRKIGKTWLLRLIIIICSLMLTMIVNGDGEISHYLGIAVSLLGVTFFINSIKRDEFEKYYIAVITVIAAYSTLITLFSNLFISFPGTLPVFSGGRSSWRHIGIFYYYWGWSSWTKIIRNAACFREPGVWGCFCVLALLFEMNNNYNASERTKKERRKHFITLVILIIGAVSSLSTTAFIALALLGVVFIGTQRNISSKNVMITVVLILAAGFLLQTQGDLLFSKFNSDSNSFISLQDRVNGVFAGVECIVRNPVLGSGYTYYISRILGTSANSFVDIWGKYGVLVFSILTFGLFSSAKNYSRNTISFVTITVLYVVLLGTQNLLVYPIFLVVSLYRYIHH